MVVERTFLDPLRIDRFIVRCEHCKGELAIPLNSELAIPPQCPHLCPGGWEAEDANALIDAMRVMVRRRGQREYGRPVPPAIRLTFEINGRP